MLYYPVLSLHTLVGGLVIGLKEYPMEYFYDYEKPQTQQLVV